MYKSIAFATAPHAVSMWSGWDASLFEGHCLAPSTSLSASGVLSGSALTLAPRKHAGMDKAVSQVISDAACSWTEQL